MLEAAKKYAEKGLSVIPIQKRSKKPPVKWTEFQKRRASQKEIEAWWKKWPSSNIGIVTGEISKLFVIDADSEAGHEKLTEMLPDTLITPMAKTPKGYHYYFSNVDGACNSTRFMRDCDSRGEGGYIIAPPSQRNGNSYEWMPGLSIFDVEPADLPARMQRVLSQEHYSNNNSTNLNLNNRGEREGDSQGDNKRQHFTTNDNISFEKGSRDESLFHVANCLIKGGMPVKEAQQLLALMALRLCDPPFPQSEINAKIQSALKRSNRRKKSLTQEIRDLLVTTNDNIMTTFVNNCLHLTTREEKKTSTVILGRLVKEGLIERTGQAGVYRKVDKETERIDFMNADDKTLDVVLPFGLDRLVEVMPGNIILIAGEPNAGKTALLLNIIRSNMAKFEVYYFNSEMGGKELKKRLLKFDDIALEDWKFEAWERSSKFADVIKPGAENINIIDYLEIHDNFYEVGGMISEIHNKLKGAIAIIALQKNPGVDVGLGGFRSLEKPRLALAMSNGTLKIVKAKNWKTSENPNKKQIDFNIVDGCKFVQQSDWRVDS